MVWREHSRDEQHLFLGLMQSCGVCFCSGRNEKGEACFVAPDLLPKFAAVAPRLLAWKENDDTPVLRLVYGFLHPAVIRELLSTIGRKAGDLAEYWKYGFWLKDAKSDCQLLVQSENTGTETSPGAGELVLKAQGRDPVGLLGEIRQVVLRQPNGAEPKELLTLAGRTVARSALAAANDGMVLDITKRPVAAAAFASFFGDSPQAPLHKRIQTADVEIRLQPVPLSPSEKLQEVFISYAWGDETPQGMIRQQAVEGLYRALAADGFQPVRDREQIQSGELISAFIRRLTRADLIVAVISDRYLRSPYCMYEIYRLWQRYQGDHGDLAQHLVPIVLPDVRIGNLRERAVYLKHWAEEAGELKALALDPKLRPGRQSWEEVRLVEEFSHHVDDILVFVQDVLMPRSLEVHLDGNFEIVLTALRRRMTARKRWSSG